MIPVFDNSMRSRDKSIFSSRLIQKAVSVHFSLDRPKGKARKMNTYCLIMNTPIRKNAFVDSLTHYVVYSIALPLQWY
jgi:hypothetical protein